MTPQSSSMTVPLLGEAFLHPADGEGVGAPEREGVACGGVDIVGTDILGGP